MDAHDVISQLAAKLILSEKIAGISATYQFHLFDQDRVDVGVKVHDGTCEFVEGVIAQPDATMVLNVRDFKDWLSGKASTCWLFCLGSMNIGGDMSVAMNFQSLLNS